MVALLFLAAGGHALLALWATREKSNASDELVHVTGGFTFNHWNDYRLHPENGLLPQRWQALPATLAGAHYPALDSQDWREGNAWMIGHRFFFRLGNDMEWMLFTARAMNALFGAATLLLVGAWARFLFGWAGAFTAVLFGALCPTMLAHSAVATSDMAAAFFLLAAASAYWWHLHDPRARVALLSAGLFGLACVAKFTAVLLLPLFVLLALAQWWFAARLPAAGPTSSPPSRRLARLGISAGLHGLTAVFVIWAFSGFRYAACHPALPAGGFMPSWTEVLSFGGWKAQVITAGREWQLLPEGYLYGLANVIKGAEARNAFLDGDYSQHGWISFFPKAFLYKTPPSLLLGLVASILLGLHWARERRGVDIRRQIYRAAPLLLLFAVYWGFSLSSHLNIGHRHLLPTYPVLYIACGALGWAAVRAWGHSRARGAIGVIVLAGWLGWHAKTAADIQPHHLAYFSPLVGGPSEGYQHLVDSSLDWGQDLPGLKQWLSANRRPHEPLFFSYFGTSEPAYYGIDATSLPTLHPFDRVRPWYWPEPGLYAISASMLQHVYLGIRGPWTPANEKRYQELRRLDADFRLIQERPAEIAAIMRRRPGVDWAYEWSAYEQLRFARLCHYLRARRPDAMIGYSILVFRLQPAELAAALHGPASELARAIEQALAAPPARR